MDKRVQYMIEVMFAIRKDKFKDHPSVIPELDLIEESEQFTHLITLDEPADSEDKLNVFQFDQNFVSTPGFYFQSISCQAQPFRASVAAIEI